MMTVTQGNFEWDSDKDSINIEKHGFSFSEILDVFDDPFFFEMFDSSHSGIEEDRLIGIGRAMGGFFVVTVCYTERKKVRIYSARQASKKEEALYYEQWKKLDC